MKNTTYIPPSRDPKDCICGGAAQTGSRLDIHCRCCDGIFRLKYPMDDAGVVMNLIDAGAWGKATYQ